ncbi:MAG TPA: hypothetical protein VFM01_19455 [Nakamurella sp.]|nr:hypothetical protein [Nakamurella sp.]
MPPSDPALPVPLRLTLLALLILGAAVWTGGMAAVTILSVSSRRVLEPAQRVALFRDFGRRYLVVAGAALVLVVVCGGLLLAFRPWDGLSGAIVGLVAALTVALAAGVRQARAMGRLRRAALEQTDPVARTAAQHAVTAGARRALALRTVIALLSVAVFVLAVCTGK